MNNKINKANWILVTEDQRDYLKTAEILCGSLYFSLVLCDLK